MTLRWDYKLKMTFNPDTCKNCDLGEQLSPCPKVSNILDVRKTLGP